jgi:hypothetical protein
MYGHAVSSICVLKHHRNMTKSTMRHHGDEPALNSGFATYTSCSLLFEALLVDMLMLASWLHTEQLMNQPALRTSLQWQRIGQQTAEAPSLTCPFIWRLLQVAHQVAHLNAA